METIKIKLLKQYGYGEPIFLQEIDSEQEFKLTSEIFKKRLERLVQLGEIERFERGIYYFSKTSKFTNKKIPLAVEKVIEKKYIQQQDIRYGYESGLGAVNLLGLTTQMPRVRCIVTEKTSKRKAVTEGGFQKIEIIKARMHVTKENYRYLQIFDLIANYWEIIEVSESETLRILNDYIANVKKRISRAELIEIIYLYPNKVAIKFLDTQFEQLLPRG